MYVCKSCEKLDCDPDWPDCNDQLCMYMYNVYKT